MKMKTTKAKLKTCLVALFLINTIGLSYAQTIEDADDLSVTGVDAASKANAIFCASNSFTLTASSDDGNGNAFTSYRWEELNDAGGGDGIVNATGILTITNATPGYHTYRVYGVVTAEEVDCESDEFEDFTIFVLPSLSITASVPTESILEYCTNEPPSGAEAIDFQTTAPTFVETLAAPTGLTAPLASDFIYEYAWYKKDAADANWDNATLVAGETTNSLQVDDTEVGSFNYKVVVTYKVKSTCIGYEAVVQQDGSDAIVIVTPQPGKPTITISSTP